MLLDYEERQLASLTEEPLQANLATQPKADSNIDSDNSHTSSCGHQECKYSQRGQGWGWSRGKNRGGRNWSRSRHQCQLCGKIGHLVQTCYHRFDETFSGVAPTQIVAVNYHQFQDQGGCSHINSFSHVSSSCNASGSCPRTSSTQDQAWYPDSGATNHIIGMCLPL